jgi:uridine kinase
VRERERIMALVTLIEAVGVPWSTRVAVDGPDAAGKTTLADAVASVLRDRGRTVIRASVDDFQRSRSERYRRGEYSPEGYYRDSFDYAALRRVLLDPLGPGGDGTYRTAVFDYLRDAEQLGTNGVAARDSVLIVDGVFLLRPELVDAWDFSIFVSATFDEVLRRALIRDTAHFGSTDEVERRYRERYIPAQELYDREARPAELATVVVDNNDPANVTVRIRSPVGGTSSARRRRFKE